MAGIGRSDMYAVKMPGDPKVGTFNESETRLLCSILKNISIEVNLNQLVDWDAVAQETGLKNAATSRVSLVLYLSLSPPFCEFPVLHLC